MGETQGQIRTIQELFEAKPDVDNTESFEVLWGTMRSIFEKLNKRFELNSS